MQSERSSKHQTRVILVRHGQSTFNAQGRYQGACDEAVLTDKGSRDAYRTGLFLQPFAPTAIYTSPLKRAAATASEIRTALSVTQSGLGPSEPNLALREIDLPEWQGLPFQVVRDQYPDAYRCWKEHPQHFYMVRPALCASAGPTAIAPTDRYFPVQELYAQARQFWQTVLPRHPGQTIVAVSHSGTIRALIATALGLDCEQFHTLQQSNCGISMLTFDPHQMAQLTMMNNTAHVGEALPKLKEGKRGVRLLLLRSDESQIHTLGDRLRKYSVDFCIVCADPDQEGLAATICSNTLVNCKISTARELRLDSYFDAQLALRTGVLIGDQQMLESTLSSVLGSTLHHDSLYIVCNTISAIHYPAPARSPVLQALNFPILTTP